MVTTGYVVEEVLRNLPDFPPLASEQRMGPPWLGTATDGGCDYFGSASCFLCKERQTDSLQRVRLG
jgi:hypothetical protein